MNDRLTSAARALRETHDGSFGGDASTRSRILAGAQAASRTRMRRRKFAAVWMSLAAVLVVSSAWAAMGGHVPHLVAWLRGTPHATRSVEAGVATGGGSRAGEAAATATEAPSATAAMPTEAPGVIATPAVRGRVTPSPTRSGAAAAPSIVAKTGRSILAPADAEDDLYAAAHRAHFAAHDSIAALRAWDAYLATYPAGRYGLEARYNRALALVRLGRTDEARAALTPFADGRAQGYRQAEARSLLDAIDAGR
jgi:hypothetical protein